MGQEAARFGDFEVDFGSRELRKSGALVRLQEQPFQLLAMLLERPGQVVTRDDMRARLWPDGTFVDFEHSVNAAIKRLRMALGDTADNPRFVETLHRRGYRFVAPIAVDASPKAQLVGAQSRPSDRRPRLVVLPFANLSEDTQDYFSDGLTEELIAQVGRRCGNRLAVLARTSSMLYKNVARADYLVEGSVRREGDRARITAQLIETHGETQLWAQSYDRSLCDCLAVQTDVAAQIAHALAVELLPAPRIEPEGTQHPAAYQAFLRARFHWNKLGDLGLATALAYYDEALALDPAFGKAYSARARARISLWDYHRVEPIEVLSSVWADAMRALELDPGDAEGHVALAEVYRVRDWNWAAAEADYLAALEVNPNSESTHRYYAHFLSARGRKEAAAIADRACDLDPLCFVIHTAAASVRYFGGEYEAAIRRCQFTLDMNPSFGPARRRMAAALSVLGRYDEALDEFSLISEARLDPVSRAWMGYTLAASGNKPAAHALAAALRRAVDGRPVPPYHRAMLHAGLGELDAAFDALDRACVGRDSCLDTFDREPCFQSLRGDSRYAVLRDRLRRGSVHGDAGLVATCAVGDRA